MDISEFFNLYSEESSCRGFFKERRERKGLVCGCCGSLCFYWIEKESRWKCKGCGLSVSLKKGTVMEHSNLGFKAWLWGLFLMALTKKGFSALELQRLIGHKRYEPIWLMMHKIRISMGHRDDLYTLDGFIEMDEGFFEGHRKQDDNGNPCKESDRQVKAIVAVSTRPAEDDKDNKHRPATRAGNIKIHVISSLSNDELTRVASKMVAPSAVVMTDGKPCYNTLKKLCMQHKKEIVLDKKKVCKVFPWVHIAISNVKKKLLGLHHHINDAYMQNYLNEFCYKFNRRHFGQALFDRLLVATMDNTWYKPFPNSG